MPAGRTLTQHAVPTTFDPKVPGRQQLILDANARMRAALPHCRGPGQRGRHANGLRCGRRECRGPADVGTALAHTAGTLAKLAVDAQPLAHTEVGEVSEPTPRPRRLYRRSRTNTTQDAEGPRPHFRHINSEHLSALCDLTAHTGAAVALINSAVPPEPTD
ncbi:hypothetical protein GCM10018785_25100 [Streptomyces longispororuber]|uniref:Uncharacterized protein n=1 Tax=Streptomyces longispororuber TaxID=68230 RepID=A0A918ZIH3_9ACTN|nr:hypothetical protein GCM10018785_25100 [Streptomyces longispororuber]